MSNEPLIDPEVKDELKKNVPEDNFFTEYATKSGKGGDGEKIDVTSDWIGNEGEWKAKSILSAEQIIAMTQTRLLTETFDELDNINPLLLEMVENMEKYAVSHSGIGREQHVDVLKAMHSGEMGENADRASMLLSALAGPMEDEE